MMQKIILTLVLATVMVAGLPLPGQSASPRMKMTTNIAPGIEMPGIEMP